MRNKNIRPEIKLTENEKAVKSLLKMSNKDIFKKTFTGMKKTKAQSLASRGPGHWWLTHVDTLCCYKDEACFVVESKEDHSKDGRSYEHYWGMINANEIVTKTIPSKKIASFYISNLMLPNKINFTTQQYTHLHKLYYEYDFTIASFTQNPRGLRASGLLNILLPKAKYYEDILDPHVALIENTKRTYNDYVIRVVGKLKYEPLSH